jgi:RNA polymerase sigma-70 factor (ECF subfamily)
VPDPVDGGSVEDGSVERRSVEAALTALAREDGGRVLALLARQFGDVDLAEDAVQDGLVEATRTWPDAGVPDNPAAWLFAVARRRALDALRRTESRRRRTYDAAVQLSRDPGALTDAIPTTRDGGDGAADDTDDGQQMIVPPDDPDAVVQDERLRLMLLCCHPALDQQAQVALVLRLVAGLTTPEIAAAFVVPEPTLAQRIVRAKRKIREARIPMSLPDDLTERLDAVLAVLYLVFNEGYLSRSAEAGGLQRLDLAHEALRLTRLLAELAPAQPEVEGLLALELFSLARADTRTNRGGDLVLLPDQDRTRWDLEQIRFANAVLAQAMQRRQPGAYQLQAVIAAHHANAPTTADTDWPAITAAYRQLTAMTGSPVVALNHAAAVAMADGPAAGLAALDAIAARWGAQRLQGYHLLHATRADLYRRLGRDDEAVESYHRALVLAQNPAEQRFLQARIDELSPRSRPGDA